MKTYRHTTETTINDNCIFFMTWGKNRDGQSHMHAVTNDVCVLDAYNPLSDTFICAITLLT